MKMLRILILLNTLCIFSGCGGEKKEDAAQKKEPAVESEPVDVGDPKAPVMIRALQGAKEVKEKIDTRREEDSQILQER